MLLREHHSQPDIDGKAGQVARKVPCRRPFVEDGEGFLACPLLQGQGGPAWMLTMFEGRSHAKDGADRPFFLDCDQAK